MTLPPCGIKAKPTTMPATTAIILGASGSVGQALLAKLLRYPQFTRVIVIVRRPLGTQAGARAKLVECLVPDMQPLALQQAVVDALLNADADAVGFSVLGVGAGVGPGDPAAFSAASAGLNCADDRLPYSTAELNAPEYSTDDFRMFNFKVRTDHQLRAPERAR